MRSGHRIYPDVLPELDDGLRAVVNAYAWIRQSGDLRAQSPDEGADVTASWDEEDDQLLSESMIDLSHESV